MFQLLLAACVALLPLGAMAQEAATEGAASVAAPASVSNTTNTRAIEPTGDSEPSAVVVLGDGAPDYTAWSQLADRVEQALDVGRASDQVMADLRKDLTQWRELFADAQKENSIRINTLKTQISTLGPEPEQAGVEPEILTQRRTELTAELNAARVPVQTAEEAFSRSNVLISEIDGLMRSRQADQIVKLGPTPMNPVLWPQALADVRTSARLAWAELETSWGSDAQRKDFQQDLPITLVFLAVGAVLLLRGRHWMMQLGAYLRRKRSGLSRGVVGFVVSLGQVIAPQIGIYFLVIALYLAGVLGLRSQVVADVLPQMGMLIFGALWIGNRVFGIEGANWTVLELPSAVARTEARVNVAFLGVLLAFWALFRNVSNYEGYSDATHAVLLFPVIALIGYFLVRIGRLLRLHTQLRARDEQHGAFRNNVLNLVSTATTLVGFVGPVAAAIGYNSLASWLLGPWVLTLALLAFLIVLHRFYIGLYGVIAKRDEEEAEQALWPILISLGTTVLSLPVFALIWGARTTDLTELWTKVMAGFKLGDATVTPRTFLIFAMVFVVGYAATRLLQSMLKTSILPKTKLDLGGQNAISAGVGYVGIFLAALVAITSAGLDLSSVAIVAGALSVGIGFGLQNIVSNFVSGIILLIERPISEGDWIEVGGQMGYVRDISVRSTRIETFDRSDVILPNSDLISGVVTNYTRGNAIGRIILPVGVAYGTDTQRVEEVLREVAENHPMVTVNPPPSVLFSSFGADALEFEIRAILSDVNYSLSVKSEMNHEIARRFAEEGFEIPFAQRDLWLRNPEALQPKPKPKTQRKRKKQANPPVSPTLEDMQNNADEGVEGEGDE
ncbi:DUF3772 domain-containing protein [Aliiroseovarius lamellibrachiae]|uniref:DUF3772 domain-containing protein n=1 Tax=Aliiroseovarius lamellibrachiae TaxID=1924933 RepID=UPI001BDFA61E|nr:DUF3772 domain-containing protein [Aliiroseovarius lamellibrachiae]MBT2131018.1 DUF3772 domain-containing protein [Aliiroseovarius lamellibrachiae]